MQKKILSVLIALGLNCCLVSGVMAAETKTDKTSAIKSPLIDEAKKNFKPIPAKAPDFKNNPTSKDKIELGKLLFFEPRLSSSQLISCHTCHNIGLGGSDTQETSTGHKWQSGPRNSPTVYNSVFNIAQFWDGRAPDLKEQAKGPVQASVEMNNTPEMAVATLKSMPEYVEMFKKVFPKDADPVTFDNMAMAIEAFEATLITPDSKFDKFLNGNDKSLNDQEKAGLKTFMDKGCVTCHGGVNMGGDAYHPFGVVAKPNAEIMAGDIGRFKVTQAKGDEFSFKAPTLRNITLTAPYFHSGKVWSLKESVEIMSDAQLGATLNEKEVSDIVAFLNAATGKMPKIEHPIFPASTDKTPKPKLD